jgi:hypothetical protein
MIVTYENTKEPWRKKTYEKATLELKLFAVNQIQNG